MNVQKILLCWILLLIMSVKLYNAERGERDCIIIILSGGGFEKRERNSV